MHGLGPIEREADEPIVHADWERRLFALRVAVRASRAFNIDEGRHAIERMGAAEYLATSYYEHWLRSLATLLIEKGMITREELVARQAALAQEEMAVV